LIKKNPPEKGPPLELNARFKGYCVDLAHMIFNDIVHVPHELRIVKDRVYGGKTGNGTWNGMIGELTRQVDHTYT